MPPERWTMMLAQYLSILNWLCDEEGQGLADIGLMLGLIVVVIAIAVAALGDNFLTYLGAVVKAVAVTWAGGAAG
jgi:Flp pilus assembly pilin Flp